MRRDGRRILTADSVRLVRELSFVRSSHGCQAFRRANCRTDSSTVSGCGSPLGGNGSGIPENIDLSFARM